MNKIKDIENTFESVEEWLDYMAAREHDYPTSPPDDLPDEEL